MKEVKRHAKVGEHIRIVDCNDIADSGYENGDIFIVIDDSSVDMVDGICEKYICDDNGWCIYDEEYVVLEDYDPDETKQTQIVVNKINIDINKLHNIDGADGLCLYCDELINEEREEKDMNKVLKLYEERKLKEIDEKYEKKVEDDYNSIEVVKKYNDLVKNFEDNLEKLFNSLENFDNGYIDIQCDSNCYKYVLSEDRIKNELRRKYVDEQMKEVNDVKKLVSEVDAQLSLSDDLTYQLEALSRYEIIDKKTNKLKV